MNLCLHCALCRIGPAGLELLLLSIQRTCRLGTLRSWAVQVLSVRVDVSKPNCLKSANALKRTLTPQRNQPNGAFTCHELATIRKSNHGGSLVSSQTSTRHKLLEGRMGGTPCRPASRPCKDDQRLDSQLRAPGGMFSLLQPHSTMLVDKPCL